MTDVMKPDEFGCALQVLVDAIKHITVLPLEDMAAYVERVEEVGSRVPLAFTPERREMTAFAGRLVAASLHLRETAATGGAS